jgi:hypothetical protein
MEFLYLMDGFTFKFIFMKKLIIVLVLFALFISTASAQIDPVPPHDSTTQERFLLSILKDYPLEGRWIFMRIDSLYKLENNYEVVNTLNLYDALSESFTSYNKSSYIFHVYSQLTERQVFERYGDKKYLIKGNKVNMNRFELLKKQSIKSILKLYFNKEKKIKKKYKKWLYEIIAVCYINNVKVITPKNGLAYYEEFK